MNTKSEEIVLKGFTFSFYMTMCILVTFFPLYFDYKGFSKIEIGMLYSVGPMIGIFSNLAWGLLSDKYQTVKKIMILLFTGQVVAAYLIFHTDLFALLYVFVGVFFFFQQPVNSLNDSQLMLSVSQSGRSYASFRIWGSIGFAFAAGFFGLLLKLYGSGLTYTLTAVCIFISLAITLFLKDARSSQSKIEFGGIFKIISSRKFLWFLFLVMTMSIAHRMNDGFLALYLRQLGAPDTIIGYAWMASALSEIPVFFLLSRFGHRFKELPLMAFAGLIYSVRFLIMGYVQNPHWVVWIQLMHSFSFGIFLFTAIRYMGQLVPDEYRSSGQAIFTVTWSSIAGLISGVVGGWIFDVWGGSVLYLWGSLLSLLAFIGFLVTHLMQKEA
ncbi:MFS transporter [Paenibacillus sp. GP183]|jgi:MFS transporter, PPP family, 3-phenylpropionic acid transporter|uniref:MFS transporter n=1 Tax=Paenibacillus sp. GP183 TaxID=1882751 RepID=UPI000897C529|nr:MFS transporter [Paenibacillus sp. GP183]SEB77341.1 MFS transporter, PPP family, 3-phenylpropionic acid transporter [Paenibacillus sp. GP183]